MAAKQPPKNVKVLAILRLRILNEEGRKIFIEAFEARVESVFMHPKLKRKVSYRTAIKLDCYKLIKNILEEKEFIPFSLKEGM